MDWLPKQRREQLSKFQDPDRKTDPTFGFMRACCSFNPDFDVVHFNTLTTARSERYMMDMLCIPIRQKKKEKERFEADR